MSKLGVKCMSFLRGSAPRIESIESTAGGLSGLFVAGRVLSFFLSFLRFSDGVHTNTEQRVSVVYSFVVCSMFLVLTVASSLSDQARTPLTALVGGEVDLFRHTGLYRMCLSVALTLALALTRGRQLRYIFPLGRSARLSLIRVHGRSGRLMAMETRGRVEVVESNQAPSCECRRGVMR